MDPSHSELLIVNFVDFFVSTAHLFSSYFSYWNSTIVLPRLKRITKRKDDEKGKIYTAKNQEIKKKEGERETKGRTEDRNNGSYSAKKGVNKENYIK